MTDFNPNSLFNFPDNNDNIAVIAGDGPLDFAPRVAVGTITVTLSTKPGGSSASVSGTSIASFDVAGEYIVTVQNGSNALRTVKVWAFAAAVLTTGSLSKTNTNQGGNVARGVLTSWVRSARYDGSTDTLAGKPIDIAAHGGLNP